MYNLFTESSSPDNDGWGCAARREERTKQKVRWPFLRPETNSSLFRVKPARHNNVFKMRNAIYPIKKKKKRFFDALFQFTLLASGEGEGEREKRKKLEI